MELILDQANRDYPDLAAQCGNGTDIRKMKACFQLIHVSFFWQSREGVTDMNARQWKIFESRETREPEVRVTPPPNATDPYRGVLEVYDHESCCFKGHDCHDYRGTASKTEWGHHCRRWDQAGQKFNPTSHPESGLDGNFCRNPEGSEGQRIWCYPEGSWGKKEKCSAPRCNRDWGGGGEWTGYPPKFRWGSICDDIGLKNVVGNESAWQQNDDNVAKTACGTINMIYPATGGWDQKARVINEYGHNDTELATRPMNWANVHCNGTEGNVFLCHHVGGVTARKQAGLAEFCQRQEELGVDCLPGMREQLAPPPPTLPTETPPMVNVTATPTRVANSTMVVSPTRIANSTMMVSPTIVSNETSSNNATSIGG